jgi:hypothetical protein
LGEERFDLKKGATALWVELCIPKGIPIHSILYVPNGQETQTGCSVSCAYLSELTEGRAARSYWGLLTEDDLAVMIPSGDKPPERQEMAEVRPNRGNQATE